MGLDHKNKPVSAAPTLPTGFSDIVISNKARNSLAVIVCMSAHKNNLHKSNVQCSISVRTGKNIPCNVIVSHHINRRNQGIWYINIYIYNIYHVIIQQIDRRATVQKFLDPTSEDTWQHRPSSPLIFSQNIDESLIVSNHYWKWLGIFIDRSGPHYTINNHLHQIIATPHCWKASASLSKKSGFLAKYIFFMSEKIKTSSGGIPFHS